MIKPKVVLLIFVSGKIVLTGAKVKVFPFFRFVRGIIDVFHHSVGLVKLTRAVEHG